MICRSRFQKINKNKRIHNVKIEVHHFTGETLIKKQHTHEMDTLKVLHRLAGDGKKNEFFELLEIIENEDKRKDFARMFGM